MVGFCDHGNEPSCSMKLGEFVEYLGNCYQFVKRDVAGWNWLCMINLSTYQVTLYCYQIICNTS